MEGKKQEPGKARKGGKGIPYGAAIILVHVASVNIPFTSESKEAIANIDEIGNEVRLSLQQCARKMKIHLSKKKKKEKIKSKFLLISKILPEIARKSAEMLDKPIPTINEVISQIMDIVWIDDEVVNADGIAESLINVINYKGKKQKFTLYAKIPDREKIIEIRPEPTEIRRQVIKWNVDIEKSEKTLYVFKLKLDDIDFDENNLYVRGIDHVNIVGAEKWEGE